MARTGQRLAIVSAIIASLIGYLYHAPNSEGIAQMTQVRALGALLKMTELIVSCLCFTSIYMARVFLLFTCRAQQPNY
jgi:hypothetical protein